MDGLDSLHPHGIFLRREAMDFGYRDRHLVEACRAGVIVRVRHGAYIGSDVWAHATAEQRHLLRARAVLMTHPSSALTHTTGALVHGLRLYRPDLSRVHVVRLEGNGGHHAADVVYHRDGWSAEDLHEVDGMLVLGAATCALGAASLMNVEAGLVCLDSALNLRLASPEQLWAAYSLRSQWPHSRRLQVTLRLARPGAGSVNESRGRYVFWAFHVPEPQLQYEIYENGVLIAIVDYAWPEYRTLGEMDGFVKYDDPYDDEETPAQVVFREKRREDRVREATQWQMIRYVNDHLVRPADMAARTMRMLFRDGRLIG